MNNSSTRRGSGASPDINVTPLIDVLLVLLIIFMVISPVLRFRDFIRSPHMPIFFR